MTRIAMTRNVFAPALAILVGLTGDSWTLVAQTGAAPARITKVRTQAEAFAFANEQMKLQGEVSPGAGRRFYFVEMTMGATEIKGDVAAFKIVTRSGTEHPPVGVGVNSMDRVVPVDRFAIKQFWIAGLPTGGTVVIAKITDAGVTISADSEAVVAFMYELPSDAVPTGIRLPGGELIRMQP